MLWFYGARWRKSRHSKRIRRIHERIIVVLRLFDVPGRQRGGRREHRGRQDRGHWRDRRGDRRDHGRGTVIERARVKIVVL